MTDLATTHVASGEGFDAPFIDVEEWRDLPTRHLYVHGGFTGTATRFSFYFPEHAPYAGRFFQHFTPMPDSENLAQKLSGQEDRIGFALASGAYFIETNGGGVVAGPGSDGDPTIGGYRANAACAVFSRVVAQRIYEREHRPFGYAYGGSGGAYRTFGAAESTEGVWDGFVPYVAGTPMAAPNVFTVRMHAQRVLRDVLDQIVDAVEPGGSGDPYAGLNNEQRDALREVTGMGFPIRSWFGHQTMGTQAFGVLYPSVVQADPGYFASFWTDQGYLGSDPDASIHDDRVRITASITDVFRRTDRIDLGDLADVEDGPGGGVDEAFKGSGTGSDAVVAVRIADAPKGWIRGAELTVTSGAAAGARASVRGIIGDLVVIDFPELTPALGMVRSGDELTIDNSNFLAAQTYHRHQVPGREYAVWDQYRDADGRPRLPQRPFQLAPLFAAGAAGHVPTGRFHGRMILVESLLDREAYPWQADWYRSRALEHYGAELDEHFRLWYVDNALHGDVEAQERPTHTVSYLGVLHEALLDLADWVENDTPAAASSEYVIDQGQVSIPARAADRGGVQPSVELLVDGAQRVDVSPGEVIRVTATAQGAPQRGPLVRLSWDLDGDGEFELDEIVEPSGRVESTRETSFPHPGIHFVAVRVSSQRDGDASTPFARIDNVTRARVVVA